MDQVIEVVVAVVAESDVDDEEDAITLASDAVLIQEPPRDLEREAELRAEALRAAAAEGLTLKMVDRANDPHFVGVRRWPARQQWRDSVMREPGHQFFAQRRKGQDAPECIGSFVTAEEAALAYARSLAARPPGVSGGAEKPAFHGNDLTAADAIAAAQQAGITLIRAPGTRSGFKGVSYDDSKPKRHQYSVAISRNGCLVHIGRFLTAEEAALEYARAIGPEEAAKAAKLAEVPVATGTIFHPGYVPPSVQTAEEVLRQAEAEGLTLFKNTNSVTGFKGVCKQKKNCKQRPYVARLMKPVKKHLGTFPTAEQAALCYAQARAANPDAE